MCHNDSSPISQKSPRSAMIVPCWEAAQNLLVRVDSPRRFRVSTLAIKSSTVKYECGRSLTVQKIARTVLYFITQGDPNSNHSKFKQDKYPEHFSSQLGNELGNKYGF